jgi:threonine/homoserine/homoserine lactone efflux protein
MIEILNHPFLIYAVIAFLLVIAPGADVLLVLGSALRGGARAGILTATGISIGSFIWALLVAIGLVSILSANQTLFSIITYAGVTYMLYIGIGEIRAGLAKEKKTFDVKAGQKGNSIAYIRKGLIVNLLNPKVGVFYLSFLPQFVPEGELSIGNVLALGGIHIIFGIFWLSTCSFGIDKAQSLINNDRFNRALMILAGVLIVGFALFILWSRLSTS